MKTVETGLPRRYMMPNGMHDRTCPQCGKKFTCWNAEEWGYSRGARIFCSWTCLREMERGVKPHTGDSALDEGREKPRAHNTHFSREEAIEQTRQIVALKHSGKSNEECAQLMGLTVFVVVNRLQKFGRELGWVPATKREAGMKSVQAKKKRKKE